MGNVTPFHLAIPVNDLEKMRKFYGEILSCKEGRSDELWVDFDFFGHQLVLHKGEMEKSVNKRLSNPVDGHHVPVPHFGVVLDWDKWEKLAEDLKAKGISFVIEPYIRFKGKVGEQGTMFFMDPEGNALEFKAFKDLNDLFVK